jgi:hypothetical protein
LEGGGASPGRGDVALGAALAFHGLVMNGGALDAVERASEGDLARAMAGFRWLRLEPVADLLASVRTDIDSGALDDPERADALELAADSRYQALLSSEYALLAAFRDRLIDDPHAFSAV